ncbi:MAG: hypothetical protein MJZ76_01360 [Bacteroidales bacterium]|nr:hypothetical protein [Bacteroidales bacterium]
MIIKNIIKILNRNNSLYINELGKISKEFIPAKISEGKIEPPHNIVTYSNEDGGTGFEFVSFVAQEEGLSLLEADTKIKEWTDKIKEEVAKNGRYQIANFGTFSQENDKMSFESAFIPELNIEYEGMCALSLPKVTEKEKKSSHKAGIIIFILILLASLGIAGYIFRDQVMPKLYELIDKVIPSKTLPAIKGDGTANELSQENFLPNIIWEETKEEEMVVVPYLPQSSDNEMIDEIDEINEATYAEEVIIEEESAVELPAENSTTTMENSPKPATSKATKEYPKINYQKGKYYAIAGSFCTEKDANLHAQYKDNSSYNPQLLYQEGSKNIRVWVGVFDTEAEALDYKEKHPKVWILE